MYDLGVAVYGSTEAIRYLSQNTALHADMLEPLRLQTAYPCGHKKTVRVVNYTHKTCT